VTASSEILTPGFTQARQRISILTFDAFISLSVQFAATDPHIVQLVIILLSLNLWLRRCAKIWKVAGSIPASLSGFFIDIKSFRSRYGPGVDSASNRNDYQGYFLGVKAAGA